MYPYGAQMPCGKMMQKPLVTQEHHTPKTGAQSYIHYQTWNNTPQHQHHQLQGLQLYI